MTWVWKLNGLTTASPVPPLSLAIPGLGGRRKLVPRRARGIASSGASQFESYSVGSIIRGCET